jgi:hypothetical protein
MSNARERINASAGEAGRIAKAALGIDWYDTESQARSVAEHAAEKIERLRGLLLRVRDSTIPHAMRYDIDAALSGTDQPDAGVDRCKHGVWLADHCYECAKGWTADQQSPCPQCGMTEPTMCRRLDCKLNWGGLYPVAADPKSAADNPSSV